MNLRAVGVDPSSTGSGDGTEETLDARAEFSFAERVGLKRKSWTHPDAINRLKSRPMTSKTVPQSERVAAEQAVAIQWITDDVIAVQQLVIALLDAKEMLKW